MTKHIQGYPGILCGILSIPQNIVLNIYIVMHGDGDYCYMNIYKLLGLGSTNLPQQTILLLYTRP